jgi:hypothetical protein
MLVKLEMVVMRIAALCLSEQRAKAVIRYMFAMHGGGAEVKVKLNRLARRCGLSEPFAMPPMYDKAWREERRRTRPERDKARIGAVYRAMLTGEVPRC